MLKFDFKAILKVWNLSKLNHLPLEIGQNFNWQHLSFGRKIGYHPDSSQEVFMNSRKLQKVPESFLNLFSTF